MSGDILAKADNLLGELSDEPDQSDGGNPCPIRKELITLVPELAAEIKRIREEKSDMESIVECISKLMRAEIKSYAKFSALHFWAITTIMDAWQEQKEQLAAKDAEVERLRGSMEDLELICEADEKRYKKQLADKDTELARWQEIAIEERAQNLMESEANMVEQCDHCLCDHDLKKCPAAAWYREQAAEELGIQISREASDTDKLKARIAELEDKYNTLRLIDQLNSDYEIWGGCYEDVEYDKRSIGRLTEIDPSVNWREVVQKYNDAQAALEKIRHAD